MLTIQEARSRLDRYGRFAWRMTKQVNNEMWSHRVFTIAAGLSFYSLLSLVPLMIVFASVLHFLPVEGVLSQMLATMANFIPPDSMIMVEKVVTSILEPGHGKLVSFGILSYLWAATGGFSALIEALNVAYDVPDCRPWWRDRLQALLMTSTVGALGIFCLLTILVGPHFVHFLMLFSPVPQAFAMIWPLLRWAITIMAFIACLELMYYLGPNAKHTFWSTLPGAGVAVGMWFLGSAGLSFYLNHLANYNKTYGSMGAVIGLMMWLYITSLAILIGAELNSELGKDRSKEKVPSGCPEPAKTKMQPASLRQA